MSESDVGIVRELNEAFLRGDAEAAMQRIDEDIEWDITRIAATVPDLVGVYRGPEGHRALWRAWLGPWSKFEYEYELVDAGEVVVSLIRNQRQWGRHSGAVTEIPDYAWVYEVRNGRVVRGCFYADHRSALEDHGLA